MSSQKAKSTTAGAKAHHKKVENGDCKMRNKTNSKEAGVKQLDVNGQEQQQIQSVESVVSCAPSAPFCRICHDDDSEETLISPCDCKGSLNYCHTSCLRSWLTEKVQNLKEPSCEICQCSYEVRYERVGRRDWGLPCRQFRGRREFIHLVVMSFCLLVLGASIAYTCWGAFSTSELAHNFRMSPLSELTYSVYFIIDALCILVIIVEFHVGIWPLIKKWWSSNLSVVIIDKNNVPICTESLRVVEEASSLLDEEGEDGEEEEEEVGDEEEEEEDSRARGAFGDGVARVSDWWVKQWTRRGIPIIREQELEEVEMGEGPVAETREGQVWEMGQRQEAETGGGHRAQINGTSAAGTAAPPDIREDAEGKTAEKLVRKAEEGAINENDERAKTSIIKEDIQSCELYAPVH